MKCVLVKRAPPPTYEPLLEGVRQTFLGQGHPSCCPVPLSGRLSDDGLCAKIDFLIPIVRLTT